MMHYLAILIAAISNFVLGFVWYSKALFGNTWQHEAGLSDEQIQQNMQKHGAKPFMYAFVYAIFAAIGFHLLAQDSISLSHSLQLGLIVGVLLVATSFGVNYQFANRSNKLFLIDAGYHIFQFIIYALVFWYIK